MQIFSKFFTDFVDWNAEKGHQGKNALRCPKGLEKK